MGGSLQHIAWVADVKSRSTALPLAARASWSQALIDHIGPRSVRCQVGAPQSGLCPRQLLARACGHASRDLPFDSAVLRSHEASAVAGSARWTISPATICQAAYPARPASSAQMARQGTGAGTGGLAASGRKPAIGDYAGCQHRRLRPAHYASSGSFDRLRASSIAATLGCQASIASRLLASSSANAGPMASSDR
jgi:hypothetical protein